jgi:type I restriction enzyme, S subunit
MSWETAKIGDVLAKVKRAGKLQANQYQATGRFPVIDQGQNNIAGYSDNAEIVHYNPLPIVIFGDHTRRVKMAREPFICGADGTQLLYPKNDDLDPEFFYYAVKNIDLSNYAYARHFKFLKDQEISYPDLPTQQRIAGILSAYDDLIENNRRRIGLLEQAARLLYREWFVHLRFPGHETAKIVDGLPEGWRILTVEASVKRLPPGKLFSQATASAKGTVPILDQGKSGQLGFHDEQPSFVASIDDPVIVFANHTCYQRVIHYPFSAIQNVLPFKPSPNVPNEIYWLHHATFGLVKLNAYKGHWPEFKIKELPVPNASIAAQFTAQVGPMHIQMHQLEMLNSQLTRARDLLLPRLMDGRIPV